jgi:ribonuclease P protein component
VHKSESSNKYLKENRLRKKSDYRRVLKNTISKLTGKYVHINVAKSENNIAKLGLIVKKSFGKAHIRNKFKRHIKEIFRTSLKKKYSSNEIVIISRTYAKEATQKEISEEISKLLDQKN